MTCAFRSSFTARSRRTAISTRGSAISRSSDARRPSAARIALFLLLIAAGLAGNFFRLPLFLNIDFLFGSIFAMLALQFFGLGQGIGAGALIAGYTYVLWNHPYAVVIMSAEVAVVGWLMARRKMGMVLADALYWLLIGIPMVYVFYHGLMDVPTGNTTVVMVKQALNGIANALVARLIFTGFAIHSHSSLISLREMIYNLLAFFVLCPALIQLAVSGRADFDEIDQGIRRVLLQDSRRVAQSLERWVQGRESTIVSLAQLAATRAALQMQGYLELAGKSDANFMRIGLLDAGATTTAYFPLLDEMGRANVGKNFADRSYIPVLKARLEPMLSEVVMGRIGIPRPIVQMLAPVIIGGRYAGYVTGILSVKEIQDRLADSVELGGLSYTLIDRNGKVIISSRSDQPVMQTFERRSGTLVPIAAGINQWLPFVDANTPISEQWKNSFYVAEAPIGGPAQWVLILEQAVAPFQKTLYASYTGKMALLFLILLLALIVAEVLSRKMMATLEKLGTLTRAFPARLTAPGAVIDWPQTAVRETHRLVANFTAMAGLLREQFNALRQANQSLEQRVAARTAELVTSEEYFRLIFENSGDAILFSRPDGSIVSANPGACRLFGYTQDEFRRLGRSGIMEMSDPRLSAALEVRSQSGRFHGELRCIDRDGRGFEVEIESVLFTASSGEACVINQFRDISERQQQELKNLAAAILLAQEGDRARLSHELHDEIGQSLTALRMTLRRAQQNPADRQRIESCLADGQQMLDHLMSEVRSIAYRLRPPEIDQLGLVAALRSHLDKVIRPLGQQVTFAENLGESRLSASLELCCFRVVQEGLTNALRHARATLIEVSLHVESSRLILSVSDNGMGFDTNRYYSSPNTLASLGLIGMRERVAANGGNLQIRSSPETGTELLATFALAGDA